MLDKIGIEREYWLLRGDEIIEPHKYGFPFDEFGFLVEMRTHPYTTSQGLIEELERLTKAHEAQAEALGLRLKLQHRRFLGKNLINYLKKEYAWDYLPDLTANIYSGVAGSHATGINNLYGTAGVHVHFSRYNNEGRRVQLPIREIVMNMDARFNEVIAKAKRIRGEYEIKPWGFEFRSLPCTVNIEEVAEFAFYLLERYRKDYV